MEGFRQKTEEELQNQIEETTESLGVDISRPSLGLEIAKLPLEEIKAKYPERYEAYLKILRAQKNNQEIDAGELEEMQEWISSLNNLDSYITKHTPHYEKFEARDKRQLDVFEDIRDSLERGEKEGYIKLPTGVGKTVLFSRVVESLGLKTLIVVPSKILVGQTGEKLEEFTDVEFGKYFQGEKNLSENVTVTTYLSLIKGVKNGSINPDEYHALVLDEVHKALGEETSKVIKQFKGVKLGFTATPKYSEDKHVSDLLEHEIHSMGIVEAAKEGLISRFKSYIAYTDTDLSKVEVKNREKYDENELERAIDQEGRNQSATELYKKEFEGQLAVAYCGGVTHAKHVAELFNASGISAEIISGDTPDDDKDPNGKKAILERFKTGETKVLCNARILIEGFDEPKASVCLNLQPTLSLVDAEQRAGRVLRIDPEDSDKWAYIVDFIDRDPRVAPRTFAEIAEASEVDGEHTVAFDRNRTGNITGREKEDRDRIPDIDIKGLKVVVDTREVFRISSDLRLEREKLFGETKKSFLPYDTLMSDVVLSGISSTTEYFDVYDSHPGWPSNPAHTYKDQWVDWPTFLGKEKKEFLSYENLQKAVKELGIDSVTVYKKECKNYKGWHANPERFYKGVWKSWPDFFKKEAVSKLSFMELKKAVLESGVTSQREYYEVAKKHPSWYASPNVAFKDEWLGWDDLLGREKKTFLPYNQLATEVRVMKLENRDEYLKEYVKHLGWPSNPNTTHKDQWVDWDTFLGLEGYISYDELKSQVASLGITSREAYKLEYPKHKNWPSDPANYYKKTAQWLDWYDFFSKEKPMNIPFEQLKEEVKQAGIKSQKEYFSQYKNHKGWPSGPHSVYKDKWNGWASLWN